MPSEPDRVRRDPGGSPASAPGHRVIERAGEPSETVAFWGSFVGFGHQVIEQAGEGWQQGGNPGLVGRFGHRVIGGPGDRPFPAIGHLGERARCDLSASASGRSFLAAQVRGGEFEEREGSDREDQQADRVHAESMSCPQAPRHPAKVLMGPGRMT
jgi:hypothetical protein